MAKLSYDPNSVITILSPKNPKRGGAGERFNYYRDGMKISEYLQAVGQKYSGDIKWDIEKGFIELEEPAA